MKVAILGTRGIPNNYGGYEAFAENFSVRMVQRGHEVAVFNSSLHPYQESSYKGVEIIHCSDPENTLGTAGQFIYDLNCIRECRKRNFDVILQLGYTSSSVWSFLFPKDSVVVTNMDGLEWKRGKYSAPVKIFLKQAEKWAVRYSDHLIADNTGIQTHLEEEYKATSTFIPYGADIFSTPNENALKEFSVLPYRYNLIIARLEPENYIETIIRAHLLAETKYPLLIVGNIQNKFGEMLRKKHASSQIVFLNGIYESEKLNQLRWFSHLYFHGHSVGGTNPSLLEAMAASTLICAHDNIFNRSVLGQEAFYFKDVDDIVNLLNQKIDRKEFVHFIAANCEKITRHYTWNKITDQYESLFQQALKNK